MVRIESLVINVTNATPEQVAQITGAKPCNCKKCRERREAETATNEKPSFMDFILSVVVPAVIEQRFGQQEQEEEPQETEEKETE
jgi:hypothetical protein